MQKPQEHPEFENVLTMAIETYAEMIGMTFEEAAAAAMTDESVYNSIVMLMFAVA